MENNTSVKNIVKKSLALLLFVSQTAHGMQDLFNLENELLKLDAPAVPSCEDRRLGLVTASLNNPNIAEAARKETIKILEDEKVIEKLSSRIESASALVDLVQKAQDTFMSDLTISDDVKEVVQGGAIKFVSEVQKNPVKLQNESTLLAITSKALQTTKGEKTKKLATETAIKYMSGANPNDFSTDSHYSEAYLKLVQATKKVIQGGTVKVEVEQENNILSKTAQITEHAIKRNALTPGGENIVREFANYALKQKNVSKEVKKMFIETSLLLTAPQSDQTAPDKEQVYQELTFLSNLQDIAGSKEIDVDPGKLEKFKKKAEDSTKRFVEKVKKDKEAKKSKKNEIPSSPLKAIPNQEIRLIEGTSEDDYDNYHGYQGWLKDIESNVKGFQKLGLNIDENELKEALKATRDISDEASGQPPVELQPTTPAQELSAVNSSNSSEPMKKVLPLPPASDPEVTQHPEVPNEGSALLTPQVLAELAERMANLSNEKDEEDRNYQKIKELLLTLETIPEEGLNFDPTLKALRKQIADQAERLLSIYSTKKGIEDIQMHKRILIDLCSQERDHQRFASMAYFRNMELEERMGRFKDRKWGKIKCSEYLEKIISCETPLGPGWCEVADNPPSEGALEGGNESGDSWFKKVKVTFEEKGAIQKAVLKTFHINPTLDQDTLEPISYTVETLFYEFMNSATAPNSALNISGISDEIKKHKEDGYEIWALPNCLENLSPCRHFFAIHAHKPVISLTLKPYDMLYTPHLVNHIEEAKREMRKLSESSSSSQARTAKSTQD